VAESRVSHLVQPSGAAICRSSALRQQKNSLHLAPRLCSYTPSNFSKAPMSTAFHASYWAHALTLSGAPDSVDQLSRAIGNARVDLNPHQVDAALFALRPLSKGALLADEVGLGKTIEAALVIAQRWAERHRKIVIIVPASLRKQWQQELWDKFFLPAEVLEARSWKRALAEGTPNPFEQADKLILCSFAFAARNRDALNAVPWDLAVIDEAHRLRNVHKTGNKTAQAIVQALGETPKLLLTATPLQNSLQELYGLVSIIDERIFGDAASFRDQFLKGGDDPARDFELRQRLEGVCQRTLRKQVLEYVRFTQRVPVTHDFCPSDDEHQLYEEVSEYLRRPVLYALPAAQRALMTMVLRKLLASSSFAIGNTLEALAKRLRGIADENGLNAVLQADYEAVDEVVDEWDLGEDEDAPESTIDPALLAEEVRIVDAALIRARNLRSNAKGDALLRALASAFEQAPTTGSPRKAVIFTESRRTQDYLFGLLTENGHQGRVVMLNGSNTDETSKRLYAEWLGRHAQDGTATGARAVDVRAAVVEAFREEADILLATEAAAEGVNLQFCALVINYDLPWNPQRVEQRIGRCHRYGQKHDVVVVNFLNERNAADRRVLELLTDKFRLFEGVFGASDEILGALDSGVDIERRIAALYQTCRTPEEISAAFDALRAELETQIHSRMGETRRRLLDHFDDDVQRQLKVHRDAAQALLDERGAMLLRLTRFELAGLAEFAEDSPKFRYGAESARPGTYCLHWQQAQAEGATFYRVDHPLAVLLIERARTRPLAPTALTFDYRGHGSAIAALQPFLDASGWLACGLLTVRSVTLEEHLILAAMTDDGRPLDGEQCLRLMRLDATETGAPGPPGPPDLDPLQDVEITRRLKDVERRNGRYFDAEVLKLDRWSDDLKLGLERAIKDIDLAIKEARRRGAVAISLAEKLEVQQDIKSLEQRRNRKRRDLYEEQDRIDAQRSQLIEGIERQLRTTHEFKPLFTFRWTLA
jgi:superfamily II DNA or RNA helicase